MRPKLIIIAGPNGSGKTTFTPRCFSTTGPTAVFSAPNKLDFIQRAKEANFFIRFFFIGTDSPEINAGRVTRRELHGGHEVPIAKIISRYSKSIANASVALMIADRGYGYDNSVTDQDYHQ